MILAIAIVVEARERAVLVRLAGFNQPCVWIPRSAIQWGEYLEAGESGEIDLSTWAYNEIMEAIARAEKGRQGTRVLDGQISLWRGEK